jgi:hypothetical protein
MRNPFQSNVRRPWLLLSATLLLAYALTPFKPTGELDVNAVATLLEIIMFLLSFPLSILAVVASQEFGAGLVTRTQYWALALALGYFQWFHLAPLLLRRRRVPAVTLNLADASPVAPAAPAARPPAALTAADDPPVQQFNERGRTPLERIIEED